MRHKLLLLTIMMLFTWNLTGYAGESIDANTDKDLKAVWASMINRLQAGDTEGAIEYFTSGSRWKYKDEFMSAKDKLPEIFSKMGKIEPVYIEDDEAKYRVRIGNANDEYTHYIWFRKDIFGRWKIEKF